VQRVGLVSTNSIRGGANRKVLDAITDELRIFNAWSDEAWVNDGAAVRVSLVCFTKQSLPEQVFNAVLDGASVSSIYSDLVAGSRATADLTTAKVLSQNVNASFQGSQKIGAFDISGCHYRTQMRARIQTSSRFRGMDLI